MNAIFLDRDGVVIRKAPEGDYVKEWSEVEFLPGSLEAIAEFSKRGSKVIIITNQRGVATGQIGAGQVDDIHAKLKEVIAGSGGHIAAIYYCPHEKSAECDCRKPRPGMLLQAASDHGLRLSDCWMVGDSPSDIAAGKAVGCRTVLITTTQVLPDSSDRPDLCAETLVAAARHILCDLSLAAANE